MPTFTPGDGAGFVVDYTPGGGGAPGHYGGRVVASPHGVASLAVLALVDEPRAAAAAVDADCGFTLKDRAWLRITVPACATRGRIRDALDMPSSSQSAIRAVKHPRQAVGIGLCITQSSIGLCQRCYERKQQHIAPQQQKAQGSSKLQSCSASHPRACPRPSTP